MGKTKEKAVELLINRRISQNSKKLIKKISSINLDPSILVNPEIIKQHQEKWAKIFKYEVNPTWLKWYIQKTGIESPDFIPENVFYTVVEPIINNSRFTVSYSDKNFYDLIYPSGLFPENLIRNIDGFFYDHYYKPLDISTDEKLVNALGRANKVFVKPATEAGGGREVELFNLKDGEYITREGQKLTLKLLNKIYNISYVIQEPLSQYPALSFFNSTSLNTIRVVTYRSPVTNKINILQSVFRVGAKDQFLDNSRAGGFSIGMNAEGKLNKFALRKDGSKFDKINDVNLAGNEYVIPMFDEIKKTSITIAEKNIHHRMLALDMTINKDGKIHCIEVNNRSNEINFHQLNNGPIFGEYTDEVIEYCQQHLGNLYKELVITTIPFVP